jgi:DNA mismatch endonuclease (patch repair protein)
MNANKMKTENKSPKPTRADFLSPAERSARMALIKSRDTKPELLMARLLRAAGLKYRRATDHLPGKPDFILVEARVAVFVDGDFWHGKDYAEWEHKLSPYWLKKIPRNMARDKKNDRLLRAAGWSVVRIWESGLTRRPAWQVGRIKRALSRRRAQ